LINQSINFYSGLSDRSHFEDHLVPGTAAVRRRRQSMKPSVEVKSMNHRPAADCASCPPPPPLDSST